MKKLIAIIASALTLGAFAKSAADPVITADTSAVESGTTCTVMAGDEELFDFTANGGEVTMELDEIYVGKRICLMANGEEITDSTEAQMGAANVKLAAIKLAGEPTPVAVWNGFANLSSGGFTWTNTGCTVDENGVLTIGKTEEGGGLSMEFGESSPFRSGKTLTLALDIETPTFESLSMIANILQAGSNVSIAANGDRIYQCWGTNSGYGDCAWENGTRKTIVITYKGVSNVGDRGTRTYFDGEKKIEKAGLMTGSDFLTKLCIGSYHGVAETGAAIAEGMKVYRAALYDTNLTEDQAKNFTWPNVEIFDGTLPLAGDIARFTDASWTGTVWLKNQTGLQNLNLNNYGNANSKICLTGISGYQNQGSHVTPTVELIDETDASGNVTKKALEIRNGWTGNLVIIDKLIGSGTLDVAAGPVKTLIKDSSEYTGTAKVTVDGEAGLIFGNVASVPVSKGCVYDKKITIVGETPVQINKAWTAPKGIVVNGTLNVASTIAKQSLECDLLVSADGTVNVGQTDWIKYSVESEQNINIKGTLNLGTTRQTLKANNKINIYPGATITGTAAGVDGGCHINTFNGDCVISMVADGSNTESATISAIIGPQGSAATIDVADGLTLNLAAEASSTGAGRTNGLVKTGDGTLNITGKYNTLAGLTLNGGTIIVAEGATIPASGVVTTVEGKEVSCTDGVYTLVDVPSAPGEEFIPEGEKAEYEAWAATNVPAGEYTTDQKANFAIAFHLGASVSEGVTIEDAAQAKVKELIAQIDLAALADPEGGEEAALTTLNTELAEKGLVASLAPVELEGTSETTKLYQLVIKLIEEN